MTAERQKQARIWPSVLIATGLLLFVTAILLNLSPTKPGIQIVYAGYVPSTDFYGETWAVFWATNSSSRAVMLKVTCIETNALGQWYSDASSQPGAWMHVDGRQRKFHLIPPSGLTTWRARFAIS